MATKKYSEGQLAILRANPCVTGCTGKYVTFTGAFRKEAVRLYGQCGLPPREIFSRLGFPEFLVRSEVPGASLKRWRQLLKKWGLQALEGKRKWRKPWWRKGWWKAAREEMLSLLNKEDQICYLQAQVAYLKAEIAFRKGVRAGKEER